VKSGLSEEFGSVVFPQHAKRMAVLSGQYWTGHGLQARWHAIAELIRFNPIAGTVPKILQKMVFLQEGLLKEVHTCYGFQTDTSNFRSH
jgi:hypothetical protein